MSDDNANFTGKVAFVTGAANGIGRAAALAFASKGASVVVVDVSDRGNEETARLVREAGGNALAVRCDVSRAEDVKAARADGAIEAGCLHVMVAPPASWVQYDQRRDHAAPVLGAGMSRR